MKTKATILSLVCGMQLSGGAVAFASAPYPVPAGAPKRIAQADVDAQAAAGLETVYKIKARHPRGKSRPGFKHSKKRRSVQPANASTASSEGNSCCASSPM